MVLLVRGEYEGIAIEQDLLIRPTQLPDGDRQLVILPSMAHAVVAWTNRHELWYVMKNFLAMPPVEMRKVTWAHQELSQFVRIRRRRAQ